jgi:hypothetical protein
MTTKRENCSPHGWTLDTLEKYLADKIDAVIGLATERETRTSERFQSSKEAVITALAAQEKAVAAAMSASEKAILKAEAAQEKRAEASNEIRAAMIDQQKNFADKSQTEFRFGALDQRVDEYAKGLSKRLDGMDTFLATLSGQSKGSGMTTDRVFQILTAIGVITAIIISLLRTAGH